MAEVQGINKLKKKQEKRPTLRDSLAKTQSQGTEESGIAGVSPASSVSPSTPPFSPQASASASLPNKEAVRDRGKVRQISLVTPDNFEGVMKQIDSISSTIPESQRKELETRRTKIERLIADAQDKFGQDKESAEWASIAETLGHALTQLGAGAYGIKHNIDLSGIPFNKADWSKEIDRAERELERNLGRASKLQQGVDRDEELIRSKLAKDDQFRKRAILENYMSEQKAARDKILQAERLAAAIEAEKRKPSPESKQQQKAAMSELKSLIKKEEQRIKLLDKSLAEANAAARGEEGASIEKVTKMLGGEEGEKLRSDISTPATFLGMELWWDSLKEEEAPKVIKGYLQQAKSTLEELKKRAGKLIRGESPEEAEEDKEIKGPTPGDVIDGYEFLGGDSTNKDNYRWVGES